MSTSHMPNAHGLEQTNIRASLFSLSISFCIKIGFMPVVCISGFNDVSTVVMTAVFNFKSSMAGHEYKS